MNINELELIEACQVLFGGQLDVSREFLEYIQWSGVKSAYRKKVRETHPDGVALKGELVQRRMADEFRSVQKAYEDLSRYLTARDKGYNSIISHQAIRARPSSPASGTSEPAFRQEGANGRRRRKNSERPYGGFSSSKPKQKKVAKAQTARPATSSLYKGPVPNRKLLFGHFLYYSGLINWRTIVKALAWQKNNRPRVGELGKRVGWLTVTDVEKIIRNRKGMESFGQSALHQRLLNPKQLESLIAQQKRLQRKFGEFFIAHKIFSPEQMESLAQECKRHNHQFSV